MHDAAALVVQDDEHQQEPKGGSRHNEKIDSRQAADVVLKECPPGLRWRRSTTGHVGGNGPGSINVPIVCGGIIVNPGDIVLGDEDGIIVIPRLLAEEVLDTAGQGRREPFPPKSRAKAFTDRGHAEKLRALSGIEWR